MILAFVLFAVSAIGVVVARVNLIAAGLAFWVLAQIIP